MATDRQRSDQLEAAAPDSQDCVKGAGSGQDTWGQRLRLNCSNENLCSQIGYERREGLTKAGINDDSRPDVATFIRGGAVRVTSLCAYSDRTTVPRSGAALNFIGDVA
jgi:hypothetical protein